MNRRKKQLYQDKNLTLRSVSGLKTIGERRIAALNCLGKCHDFPPPKFEIDSTCNKLKSKDPQMEVWLKLVESFGSGYMDFIMLQANHLFGMFPKDSSSGGNGLLAFMHGLAPKDEVESLLGTQMAAVHQLAMTCLHRAATSTNAEIIDSAVNQSSKLSRTFALQVEALNRYRGKGQQKVTVEHVTVNSGGQAIVGNVVDKGGGNEKK